MIEKSGINLEDLAYVARSLICAFLELVQTDLLTAFWLVQRCFGRPHAVRVPALENKQRFVRIRKHRMRSPRNKRDENVTKSTQNGDLVFGICDNEVDEGDSSPRPERMHRMGKRTKLKWPDRIKQPSSPTKIERHTPHNEVVFGLPITRNELESRVLYRKAF